MFIVTYQKGGNGLGVKFLSFSIGNVALGDTTYDAEVTKIRLSTRIYFFGGFEFQGFCG